MYRLEFELPGLPKRTNQSMGRSWQAAKGHRDKWKKMVWAVIAGKTPAYPLPLSDLVLTRFSSMEPDFDGLVSGFKPIIDALKGIVIVDDKPSNINPQFRWEKCKPKEGKIRVLVYGKAVNNANFP